MVRTTELAVRSPFDAVEILLVNRAPYLLLLRANISGAAEFINILISYTWPLIRFRRLDMG
jgi:hypothetical protein